MKPNPWIALAQSRKAIVGLGSVVMCALVLLKYQGPIQEKMMAMGAVSAMAWKLIDAIAKEDMARAAMPPKSEDVKVEP